MSKNEQSMTYEDFLKSKEIEVTTSGISVDDLNPQLFDFQREIVTWALNRGQAAIFADCGLGKTPMQLEWARHAPGRTIIVAPLAVAAQTVREAEKFNVPGVAYLREDDKKTPIAVTNYEMLERFDPADFGAIVLDESSILKSYTGKFKKMLIATWGKIPFRLAATATPAPNDYMELGNHSEFLGAMTGSEMLSAFFINDAAHVGKYRLKGHAKEPFWEWMSRWSVMLRKPSDIGHHSDEGYTLPDLNLFEHVVEPPPPSECGLLFELDAHTMGERQSARRNSIDQRVALVSDIVAREPGEQWLIWCDLNAESDKLTASIDGAVQVKGSDKIEDKEDRMLGFASGKYRVLVTKPSIAGFGMNFQGCARMAFTGLSDSFEQYYQATRRCWRFGQKRDVDVHIAISRTEGAVLNNIRRKERQANEIADGLCRHLNQHRASKFAQTYHADHSVSLPDFLKA